MSDGCYDSAIRAANHVGVSVGPGWQDVLAAICEAAFFGHPVRNYALPAERHSRFNCDACNRCAAGGSTLPLAEGNRRSSDSWWYRDGCTGLL